MKIYMVGGAVRDQLLGYPVKERDWVVIGASPEQMTKLGFAQVGKDFPVFLHPQTKEEYALARTERKIAGGYYGFQCSFNPNVTLEEDLARRDLTINAMALDEKGHLIDPYQGKQDLAEKKLRHVSPAFIEDPVRVLRVARFAARYHHLGFRLADETRLLMYQMVKNKELESLVPERVWQEWYKSLEEKNPEIFIKVLRQCGALAVILPELDQLYGIPNPPQYHAEIDTGIHSELVLQVAASLSIDPKLRFAALVHDLGKALTPRDKWPKHHGHEALGCQQIDHLCHRLRIPSEYRKLALMVSRYHLLIHQIDELKPETILKVLERVDAFRRPEYFHQLLLACQADAQGRLKNVDYEQAEKWRHHLKECVNISAQDMIMQGYQGAAIKEALHQHRLKIIAQS